MLAGLGVVENGPSVVARSPGRLDRRWPRQRDGAL